MTNSTRTLYDSFLKKGMAKDAAFFAVIDHLEQLWNYDRNRYDERIRKLEATVARLDKASEPE